MYSPFTKKLEHYAHFIQFQRDILTGADPGFPVGGGANTWGGGCHHTILPNFPKNCMKVKKIWAMGVHKSYIFVNFTVADLRRGHKGRTPPWGSKFFQFCAVFRKIWQIRMLPPPPRGNPGSATALCCVLSMTIYPLFVFGFIAIHAPVFQIKMVLCA